ncbi:hypothetical protein V9L05_17945 [Bernardetia sp. Wsw4-3y2]|uniref:hypothetical protein n=1 Tax=Bernardetia sp. Wsw4-3y2 TaxID=3127471 RepID=UPI0030D51127
MSISTEVIEVENNILQLEGLFIKVIGEFCEKNNHKITYLEIDAALINTLKKNSEYQIKGLVERKEKEGIDKIKE